MKVAIIGGGIIGLSCAYYLHKKGYEISVIDKGDISNGCSFGNAGYVAPSHFTPLASPGIIAQGLRWMLSSSSPFYIKPRLNTDLLAWAYHFWKNANKETATKNAPHLSELLHLSRHLTSQIKEELGNTFRMEEKGILMLYKTEAVEHHEMELAKKGVQFNLETKILSAAEVQELEPDVKVDVRGGVLYPIDAHLHPGELMQTLYSYLKRNGVSFHATSTVTGFERKGSNVTAVITSNNKIPADEIVLAAGSWLPQISKQLGVRMNLQAGKGYSMTFSDVPRNLKYPSILVDSRVAMTPLGADLRMGGTMEISGINERVMINRARAIFDASKKYYPDLPLEFPDVQHIWSGLRPLSPDGLPYIGRTRKYTNIVVAGGHAMLGLSLAAGTGKLVEEIISRDTYSVPIDAFAVERFN